jgi:hypothetical protein
VQLVHRYALTRRRYNWNVAAEIICLIAVVFLAIALLLAIVSIWMQRDRKRPTFDQRPSDSAFILPGDVGPAKSLVQQTNFGAYGGHCFNS